ncbi:MAG TPA: tRNA pseudouridine(38-40) synthase TruA [Bacillus sp. (in: firmicutes)]|nr:tRNA pseudouridine(38-40) synthase TruA [Bacillus sp. (in: firmicutes)]
MKRLKCTISYDGTHFSGYQVQPNQRTVQGEFEEVLKKMHSGQTVKIHASGRTDAHVHAYGQVIHFDTSLNIPADRWKKALNSLLPEDIAVREVQFVPMSFHARFNAVSKEYRYKITKSQERNVFQRYHMYHFPYDLDYIAMKEAIKYVIGTHDFTSFCSAKTEVEDKVRTIYEIEFFEENDELTFRFIGNGFLYNMVRILVGTLLDVGQGKIKSVEIKKILDGRSRELAGKTAPGHGLYLWQVHYDN